MSALTHPARLSNIVFALRNGELRLADYIAEVCDRIEAVEPEIAALLPDPDRRERLLREAAVLERRWPYPDARPMLYGALVGVKDIFHADGFVTRAGTKLPPELFAGSEATSVRLVKDAGALVLGKAVTTEFAGFAQNGTRNPHNPAHTPGGSSSGSAAAVAAGYCPLAFGSQTVGSVIRPAAFCGVVGFKPTYGRIPIDGVIPYSPSVDTVGMFTQDVAGMCLAAEVLCRDWQPVGSGRRPVLGVPDGAYLQQASPQGLRAFEQQVAALQSAGYIVKRVRALDDIAEIDRRHRWMTNAEAARFHESWLDEYRDVYRDEMREVLVAGLATTPEQVEEGRAGRLATRQTLKDLMDEHGLDLWICPPAPGPAPHGIESTGNPMMNLVWTHAGLPALSVPAGKAANGLPLGLQIVGRFNADEALLGWSEDIARDVTG
ncbi:MAG TPA: amidase [Thermomicrobiales bacterium]|nr:amidase [Thermomicrobiales bacterium]